MRTLTRQKRKKSFRDMAATTLNTCVLGWNMHQIVIYLVKVNLMKSSRHDLLKVPNDKKVDCV